MEAGRLWMLGDFIGTNKILFKIPVYQRNYDWSESNCNRLMDDIKKIIETGLKHFFGAIVFMSKKESGFSLREYIVIDGQQRLTTMMIMLKALSDAAIGVDDECISEIQDSYLHNQHCAEAFKVKLKPIKSDNDQFLALLENDYDELDSNGHIAQNFDILKNRIDKWIALGITPKQILQALEKLEIVQIILEKDIDDPQIIFESINSTGLELSSADLIRNFLLMNAEEQERLYKDYWLYIEKVLKKGTDYSNLNLFFMQYIVQKTNSPLTSDRLYEKFVQLFREKAYTQESILQELKYYADIFKTFVYNDTRYSATIRQSLQSLRQLKQTTCYPLLIHVFDDYEQGEISEETLEKVVEFILAYLLRRTVCGVPSNTLRSMFAYLYSRVFKVTANKKKYYESINKYFFTVTSKDIMPSDEEFECALNTANLYSNLALSKFLLMDIENSNSKETLNADKLTIEHIMPQRLGVDWRYISDAEHDKYLHVLGNLSVTGYNSELSNKSFMEKKQIIKANSKAVILNFDVLDKDLWDIAAIQARGERLTSIVKDHYHVEHVLDDSIEFEYLTTITLDDFNEVTGKKLVTFKFKEATYRQNRFALMLYDIVKFLDVQYPNKLEQLAASNYSINEDRKHPHLSCTSDSLRIPWEIKPSIFIESNLSAWYIMKFIRSILDEYSESKEAFSISVIAEAATEDEDDD